MDTSKSNIVRLFNLTPKERCDECRKEDLPKTPQMQYLFDYKHPPHQRSLDEVEKEFYLEELKQVMYNPDGPETIRKLNLIFTNVTTRHHLKEYILDVDEWSCGEVIELMDKHFEDLINDNEIYQVRDFKEVKTLLEAIKEIDSDTYRRVLNNMFDLYLSDGRVDMLMSNLPVTSDKDLADALLESLDLPKFIINFHHFLADDGFMNEMCNTAKFASLFDDPDLTHNLEAIITIWLLEHHSETVGSLDSWMFAKLPSTTTTLTQARTKVELLTELPAYVMGGIVISTVTMDTTGSKHFIQSNISVIEDPVLKFKQSNLDGVMIKC